MFWLCRDAAQWMAGKPNSMSDAHDYVNALQSGNVLVCVLNLELISLKYVNFRNLRVINHINFDYEYI